MKQYVLKHPTVIRVLMFAYTWHAKSTQKEAHISKNVEKQVIETWASRNLIKDTES
jgi:hypothetical protein